MITEAANTEAANHDSTASGKTILICDTQPVAVEGMKWLIENSGDLRFAGSVPTLDAVYDFLYPEQARVAAELAASSAAAAAMEAAVLEVATAQVLEIAPVSLEELAVATIGALDGGELTPITAEAEPPMCESLIFGFTVCEAVTEEFVCEPAVREPLVAEPLDAIVIDKGLGFPGVMDLLKRLTANSHPTPIVVWGAVVTEAEALKLLQAGAKGILRRTSESGTLLTCLRAVTAGGTWMEDGIFGSAEKLYNPKRSQLTNRESQVVVLVEKGLKNRDIAHMLGIQTGTVKIHLKHIFEKTGVRGRYGLAFTGLQNKGSITMSSPAHFAA